MARKGEEASKRSKLWLKSSIYTCKKKRMKSPIISCNMYVFKSELCITCVTI